MSRFENIKVKAFLPIYGQEIIKERIIELEEMSYSPQRQKLIEFNKSLLIGKKK